MSVVQSIRMAAVAAVKSLYDQPVTETDISINTTKPEFEGEYTIVVFSFTKFSRQKPEETAQRIGEYLAAHYPELIAGFNVVKGFLNLNITDTYWTVFLQQHFSNVNIGVQPANGKKIMVEYSSPNTNKPLHLGHLRNLTALAEMGAVILPPVPAFYAAPKTLEDLVDQTVGRALDFFGHDWPNVKRWGEDLSKGKRKGNR